MVSVDQMLISILSVSVEALEMSYAEALAPQAWDLKPKDWLSPLHLMGDFRSKIYPVSSSDVPSYL